MNRYVLITGAAGGLGRSFAVECAERGWDLFLTDRYDAPLRDLARALSRSHGVAVETASCDLADPQWRKDLYGQLRALDARPWMLLNVAGLDFEGAFLERSTDELLDIVRVNVEATLATTHEVLRLRDPEVPFRLVTVSSLAGFYAMPLKATYAASKAFLLRLSVALGEELRAEGGSATVLAPAGLATSAQVIPAIDAQGLLGQVTTIEVPTAVRLTIDAALKGRSLVVPGTLNGLLQRLGGLIPDRLVARIIALRWRRARAEPARHSPLPA
jgi:hypothetical protein